MRNKTWCDGFRELLNPQNPWGRHFIRSIVGNCFEDYEVDFKSVVVDEDTCWSTRFDREDKTYTVYTIVDCNVKKLYIVFRDSSVATSRLHFIVNDDYIGDSVVLPRIIAVNVKTLTDSRPVYGSARINYCGAMSQVSFPVKELNLLYPELSNLIYAEDFLDASNEFRYLTVSVPTMSSSEYDDFCKICAIITSDDAYTYDGVDESKLQGMFAIPDSDFLLFNKLAYTAGNKEGFREGKDYCFGLQEQMRVRVTNLNDMLHSYQDKVELLNRELQSVRDELELLLNSLESIFGLSKLEIYNLLSKPKAG